MFHECNLCSCSRECAETFPAGSRKRYAYALLVAHTVVATSVPAHLLLYTAMLGHLLTYFIKRAVI